MHMERCVGGLVHDEAGRLLLIKRRNEPARGKWSLPGGRVERGETDAAAVVREVLEETGLHVEPGELVGDLVVGSYEIFDYRCTVRGGVLTAGDDAEDALWIDAAGFAVLEDKGALSDGLADTLRDWRALPKS
ncbi:NUDIX domain-containing protein [Saccharomonospora sp. NPDC006951]